MRLIDGDALLRNIRRAMYPSDMTTTIAVGICESHVKDMPTVDAVPVVHGTWIGVEYDGYADGWPVYDLWECSACGVKHDGDFSSLTHYCPNCGAKMDGEWRDTDGKDD